MFSHAGVVAVHAWQGHWLFGGNPTHIDNTFFYTQVGNVGLIGYSGLYSLVESFPRMAEACAWMPRQRGLDTVLLLGHWDKPNDGATYATATPGMYELVAQLPGCDAFDARGALKFIMGHTHCNEPHPHGHVGKGFMVSGQGMECEHQCSTCGVRPLPPMLSP